jgi:hypothetical protein
MMIFLGRHTIYIGHFFLDHVLTFFLHSNNFSFFFGPVFCVKFWHEILQVCGIVMGLGSWEYIQSPLTGGIMLNYRSYLVV